MSSRKCFHVISMLFPAALLLLTTFGCGRTGTTENGTVLADAPAADQEGTADRQEAGPAEKPRQPGEKDFEDFDHDNFDDPTNIDNPWLPLKPGSHLVYEGTSVDDEGDEEPHRIEYTVTDLTKVIDGIRSVVVWIVDYADGELVEKEVAFYAQDNDGNVWLMGEYPEEYEEGKFIDNPSWIAGIQDARAGISMQADPQEGTPSYSQGWGPAVNWTDRAQVYKTGQTDEVAAGKFDNVLVMDEFNRKEPDIKLKYYAHGVGGIRVGWRGEPLEEETLELVKHEQLSAEALKQVRDAAMSLEASGYEKSKDVYALTTPSEYAGSDEIDVARKPEPVKVAQKPATVRKITDAKATEIALKTVPGDVTAIAVEKKLGKQTIVAEVLAKDGSEVDVIIDMETGDVLATEK